MELETRLFPYKLPLKTPGTWREGVILELEDEDGIIGHGEAAPLEGFSSETLRDILDHGSDLCALPYPSVNFALDMARLEILSHKQGLPIRKLLNPNALSTLAVHSLIIPDNTLSKEPLKARGPVVKLKVGFPGKEGALRAAELACKYSEEGLLLRLDANRAWTLEEAYIFWDHAKAASIDYIEEPLKDSRELAIFSRETKCPLGLDETLQYAHKELFEELDLCQIQPRAFILKPTLIGGLVELERLVFLAKKHEALAVLSSSFESNVGLRHLAQLAAAWQSEGCCAGLDTNRHFVENLGYFPLHSGLIDLQEIDRASRLMLV
jgi:o-succinylbenzoate synthase